MTHYVLALQISLISLFLVISVCPKSVIDSKKLQIDNESFLKFPDEFKIGVSGSAYQTEGAWNKSDKGLSVWDRMTHEKYSSVIDESNGDIACDSYHKYKEDIQIVKDIGFSNYRLSLSWPRILPNGFSNYISREGIQHYKNVLDELHAQGIEPFVTIYHWDHPEVIEKMGGWMNELMVEYFADYARVVFKEFGSRVKFWTTINEPNNYCVNAYGTGDYAPGTKLPGRGPYMCVHNVLKAHARAYRIYDQEFRKYQHGKIGTVMPCNYFFPVNTDDTETSDISYQFDCGWIAHPIFSKEGDYPKVMRDRINRNSELEGFSRSRLPVFTPEEIEYIKGTFDYFGLNYYTSRTAEPVPRKSDEELWYKDSGIFLSMNKSWPTSASKWLRVVPEGLGNILRKIKDEYDNPPIYILENGYSSDDNLIDVPKIDYLHSHMKEMLLAMNRDGCNIKAYSVWSLMDSFEWDSGYTISFGLVSVNFSDPNRPRTRRLSVSWLKEVIKSRKLISFNSTSQTLNRN